MNIFMQVRRLAVFVEGVTAAFATERTIAHPRACSSMGVIG